MEKKVFVFPLFVFITLILIAGVLSQCSDFGCTYYASNDGSIVSAEENPDPSKYHEAKANELISQIEKDNYDLNKGTQEQAEEVVSKELGYEVKFDPESWSEYQYKNDLGKLKIEDGKGNIVALENDITEKLELNANGERIHYFKDGSQLKTNTGYPTSAEGQIGGIGGGSSGTPGAKLQGAMSIVQQISGILGQLGEALKGNGKGKTTLASGGDFKLEEGAQLGLAEKGDGLILAQCEKSKNQHCDENSPGTVVALNSDGSEVKGAENLLVSSIGEANIYVAPPTDVFLNGIPGVNAPPPESALVISELQEQGITAAVIAPPSDSFQYVQLFKHDLALGGEKIVVDIFKSFNDVSGNGKDLVVENGDIKIRYDQNRIYYPRTIKNGPYRINFIRNDLDKKHYFHFINYDDKKGELLHKERRVSIGDIMVEHPRISGLFIAQVRESWWAER